LDRGGVVAPTAAATTGQQSEQQKACYAAGAGQIVHFLSQNRRIARSKERAMLPDQTEYGMYVQLLSHKP
jgi:hypothetical protein